MSTHRWCCCGDNPANPCAASCDFATSYMMSGFTGNHSFNREWKADACGECSDYDGDNVKRSVGFTATFSQSAAVTLTRHSYTVGETTSCCYRADGVMNVAWTLSITDRYYRCPQFNGICEYTDSNIGNTQTDFCIQAICKRNPLTGRFGWLWTLTTCSFAVDLVETVDTTNLPANYNCEDEPPLTAPYGIVAGGASYSWWSELVAPSTLTVLNTVPLGVCTSQDALCGTAFPGTDPFSLETGCMVTMASMSRTYGPCSLGSYPYASWPPDPCEVSVLGSWDAGSFNSCVGVQLPGACAGQVDWADACCEVNLSHGWTWGLIY